MTNTTSPADVAAMVDSIASRVIEAHNHDCRCGLFCPTCGVNPNQLLGELKILADAVVDADGPKEIAVALRDLTPIGLRLLTVTDGHSRVRFYGRLTNIFVWEFPAGNPCISLVTNILDLIPSNGETQ